MLQGTADDLQGERSRQLITGRGSDQQGLGEKEQGGDGPRGAHHTWKEKREREDECLKNFKKHLRRCRCAAKDI